MDFAGRIAQIKKAAQSKHGPLFETLVKEALARKFERIEAWPEYAAKHAKYTVQDIGIDLVAYDSSGTKHAIQCKYRGEKSPSLKKSDIDSFLSACRTHKIEKIILAYVGPDLKPNVRETCRSIKIYSRRRLARLYNMHNTDASGRKWKSLIFRIVGVVSALNHVAGPKEIYIPASPAPPWQEPRCKKGQRQDAVHFWLCLCCLQTAQP